MSAALAQNAPLPSDIVKTFIAAIARKDFDAALRFVAEDVEYENMPMAKVHGHAGMRAVLEPFLAPTLENDFIVLREAAHGETVFLERLDRHRLADRWVELPVTGVWEVRGGKITLWRDYFDLATIMKEWPTA
ncbi:MAG: limonene-1,2-epoxide hydrolase family protein [Hyphomonadaceae bacterium]